MTRGSVPERQGQETQPGFCTQQLSTVGASLHPYWLKREGSWVLLSFASNGVRAYPLPSPQQLWGAERLKWQRINGFFKVLRRNGEELGLLKGLLLPSYYADSA